MVLTFHIRLRMSRGMMRGRVAAKKRTRAELVRAGMELFAEQGLDGPSLDAICQRAGYTRGAFYVHFSDREDFQVAVMREVGGPLLDALLAAADQPDTPSLQLAAQRFVQALADGSYPLGPVGGIRPHQLLQACARSERVRGLYVALVEEAIRRLARIVAADQRRGTLRDDIHAEQSAQLLLAVVIGSQTMLELGVDIQAPALALLCNQLLAAG